MRRSAPPVLVLFAICIAIGVGAAHVAAWIGGLL